MKKQTIRNKHILRNINAIITALVIIANIAAFIISDTNKTNYIIIVFFLNVYIFFIHWFLIAKQLKKHVNDLKKEALYINYPINIATFFFCLLLILLISAVILFIVNKEAFNAAFIFTFFMSIISMLFPSILLLVYIFFIIPAFIIPGFNSNRQNRDDSTAILLIFVILFSLFTAYKIITYSVRTANIAKQEKYKIITLPIQYSTKYLKLGEDITPYGKKKLSQSSVSVPFVYTAESFNYTDYNEAEIFCNSLGARIPNYLEMYNIAFNRFDTFGENYYWTSNKDGKTPLLIHFYNMSYKVEKYNNKKKPLLYCVSNEKDRKQISTKNYFYRNIEQESNDTLTDMMSKSFDDNALLDLIGKDYRPSHDFEASQELERYNDYNNEKKHVNFSVKEVSSDVLKELIQQGYVYDSQIKISSKYETNDVLFNTQINRDANNKNIRLCYYPFTDYGNMNIYNESQVWKQSFCSPAFELISPNAVLKSKNEKDVYCASLGGRVPNLPELNGILKSLNINSIGTKFWTNTKVTDQATNTEQPVYAYYKDSRFMKLQALYSGENENAYTFCIKKSKSPSRIIVNYKSRFKDIEGSSYASTMCPLCQYYEVPDTVLLSY